MQTGKIVLGSAITLGANAGIQWAVARMPFETFTKTPADPVVNSRDVTALGLELGVSTGAYFAFGPVPALLGASEAVLFFVLKLAGVGWGITGTAPGPEIPAPARPAPLPENVAGFSRINGLGRVDVINQPDMLRAGREWHHYLDARERDLAVRRGGLVA